MSQARLFTDSRLPGLNTHAHTISTIRRERYFCMYCLGSCESYWLRSQLFVAVMTVGSNSSSLPAQDQELEREMKILIHDAVSSLGFNLKTELRKKVL